MTINIGPNPKGKGKTVFMNPPNDSARTIRIVCSEVKGTSQNGVLYA